MPLPELIPLETLLADPDFSGATLSPDGKRLAYLAPKHGRTQVWVRGVDDEHDDAVCVTDDRRRGIRSYQWTDDPRWLLYRQDTDGNEDWHLFRVDLEAPDQPALDLTPLPPGSRVLDATAAPNRPGQLVVTMNPRGLYFDTFLIDVATGTQELLVEGGSILGGPVLSPELEPLHWAGQTEDGAWEFRTTDPKTGVERVVHRAGGPENPNGIQPTRLTPDGDAVVLADFSEAGDLELVRVDIATGERSVIAGLEGRSLCRMSNITAFPPSVYVSKKTGEVMAARFVGDRPTIVPVTAEFAEVYAALSQLSDGVLNALSSDADERLWVASFTHDREPDLTYLYDHATGESRLLFRPRPELDPEQLAPMNGVTYNARDGRQIHGFLTLPLGVEHRELPLVVLVHGGPWANDVWRFDPSVQLLANRGYAVLQPNFRGSDGYGREHLLAAIKQLSAAMQTDLIDGADRLVERALVDPTRIAIMGASYGGYSALVGATVTPDYFAAAVDIVGVSSLPNCITSMPAFVKPVLLNNWLTYAGDPDDPADLADMLARSPITMVDKIRIPLLIAQGAKDPRVVQAESDNMVAALRERGVPVEYLLAEDEGHGFQNPENVLWLWRAIEKHLATHLGGRSL
jgi:dipeptidyl aminopeptidase/acylaminoacyl peptidase